MIWLERDLIIKGEPKKKKIIDGDWLDGFKQTKFCIVIIIIIVIITYSWSRIFLGKSSIGPLGKLVLENISATSEFLCFSSPSLPPEARWLHTKQKLVSCNRNLTDTEPCKVSWELWKREEKKLKIKYQNRNVPIHIIKQ